VTEQRASDIALRALGLAVAVAAAVLTALLEVFLTPLRLGQTLVGVSVLLAVVGNAALVTFTLRATSARWPIVLTALAWFAVMVAASGRTTEGDILLPGNNWVGPATIFAGSIAFAVAAYRTILPPARSTRSTPPGS
jgi:hypothetical protein